MPPFYPRFGYLVSAADSDSAAGHLSRGPAVCQVIRLHEDQICTQDRRKYVARSDKIYIITGVDHRGYPDIYLSTITIFFLYIGLCNLTGICNYPLNQLQWLLPLCSFVDCELKKVNLPQTFQNQKLSSC